MASPTVGSGTCRQRPEETTVHLLTKTGALIAGALMTALSVAPADAAPRP